MNARPPGRVDWLVIAFLALMLVVFAGVCGGIAWLEVVR